MSDISDPLHLLRNSVFTDFPTVSHRISSIAVGMIRREEFFTKFTGKQQVGVQSLIPGKQVLRGRIHLASREDVFDIQIRDIHMLETDFCISGSLLANNPETTVQANIVHSEGFQNVFIENVPERPILDFLDYHSKQIITAITVFVLRAGFELQISTAVLFDKFFPRLVQQQLILPKSRYPQVIWYPRRVTQQIVHGDPIPGVFPIKGKKFSHDVTQVDFLSRDQLHHQHCREGLRY